MQSKTFEVLTIPALSLSGTQASARTLEPQTLQPPLYSKRPATTILTVKAGLVQRLPVLSFQRCGSSSSTRLAG